MSADNSTKMEEGVPLVAPVVEASTESRPMHFRAKIAIATVLSLALVCLGLAANPYRYKHTQTPIFALQTCFPYYCSTPFSCQYNLRIFLYVLYISSFVFLYTKRSRRIP